MWKLCAGAIMISVCSVFAVEFEKDANTLALWHFNAGEGDSIYDEVNSRNNGVIHDARWVEGHEGSALFFDGDSDWVELGSNLFRSYTGTIEGWIKVDSFISEMGIFCQNQTDVMYSQFAVKVNQYKNIQYSNDARLCGGDLNGWSGWNEAITAGEWCYFAVVHLGTMQRIYVNAKEVTYHPGMTNDTWFADQCSGEKTVYIGRWLRSINDISFCGAIDELRISDVARSFDEIEAHWNGITGVSGHPGPARPESFTAEAVYDLYGRKATGNKPGVYLRVRGGKADKLLLVE